MKLTIITLTLLNLISNVTSRDCDYVLSRQNIYKMSDTDRNRYFNAVKAINSGPKPTDWDKFAQKHVQYFQSIHGNPMFLPWHRAYLAELEALLRKKDPRVRIPVWDWTQYYNNRANDPIWQWFGKEGNRYRQNCVTQGVFNNFPVYYGPRINDRPSQRCYTRSPNPGTTFGCAPIDFTTNVIDEPNTEQFWKYFENTCHNSVHSAIGGGFSSEISTNDPLFYSHHAFVDEAWFLRQMRHPDWSDSYSGQLSDQIPYFNIPVSEVIDPTNLCYSYREDNYSWSPQSQLRTADMPMSMNMNAPVPKINPETFHPVLMSTNSNNGVSNTKVIDDHARKYVFKNITSPINQDTHQLLNSHSGSGGSCTPTPLPDILSIEFINMMGYNEVEVRELERKQALFINNLNQNCIRSTQYKTFNNYYNKVYRHKY